MSGAHPSEQDAHLDACDDPDGVRRAQTISMHAWHARRACKTFGDLAAGQSVACSACSE
jgi:hypothetical protein